MDDLFGAQPAEPAAPAPRAMVDAGTAASGQVFPVSADTRLVPQDMVGLSAQELRLARNEIYARHGRIFDDPALAAHFARFSWYRPRAREVQLNEIEAANVRLIAEAERGQ
jgi:hypothetical protein